MSYNPNYNSGGYAQPGGGGPGGFAPNPGQPYGASPGGFPGAPQMPGFPPAFPDQPGGGSYYPPPPDSRGYAPPSGYPPPGGSYPPPGGPPPPSGHGGYPPPGGPPPSAYGAPSGPPPPPTAPRPNQSSYAPAYVNAGAPPGGYGAPPGPPPPQGQYGGFAPPPGPPGMGMGGPGQEPPTVLYRDITVHNPRFNGGMMVYGYEKDQIKRDCDEIVKIADKEKKLIEFLTRLGPLRLEVLAHEFPSHNQKGETLHRLVERKTTRYVEAGLLGLVLGPIKYDAERVKQAIQGVGTDESLLDEILVDLTPSDVSLLAYVYEQRYKKPLLRAVQGDLSGDINNFYGELLNPQRVLRPSYPGQHGMNMNAHPDDPQQLLEDDVSKLHKSGAGRVGTNESTFYGILTGRTYDHLVQVCRRYQAKHGKTLSHDLKNEFSGHTLDVLLRLVAGIEGHPRHPELSPRDARDAVLLEETMAGFGTKDGLLVMRLLRAHWSRRRMEMIGGAYLKIYGKTLTRRVEGETSGAFEDLLVAMIKGPAF
ncbi:Annexin A4 [Favolaschia claudopus]|uniref:Annexin A4 n=1 Tax=Favolaschia claudopus TaxID=2862362 RepID=A0AAW0CB96_9AGAR